VEKTEKDSVSKVNVILAFVAVYIIWGSTYFFIHKAIQGFPPFMLGAIRFVLAGLIMLVWSVFKGEKIFVGKSLIHAVVAGLLLLFIGNGAVLWVEQYIPTSVVAIMVSSSPLWFVLLDKPMWLSNLNSKSTIVGLVVGFAGVLLLSYKSLLEVFLGGEAGVEAGGMVIITLAAISWAGGSLYSKYFNSGATAVVNSTWQMLSAGIAFILVSLSLGEQKGFDLSSVGAEAWFAVVYLVIFGSIIGFSCYVWLLKVKPATQVSTYAYVNPVVAVLLGVVFANEKVSAIQILGLAVILLSVMMINFAKYRKEKLALASKKAQSL
jgi:drug/metabolite transporter (DMT)-like permease